MGNQQRSLFKMRNVQRLSKTQCRLLEVSRVHLNVEVQGNFFTKNLENRIQCCNFTDMRISGIYKIQNKINNKVYIGKSINIKQRAINHKCALKNKTRSKDTNRYLYNSVQKYGIENFKFVIIEKIENPTETLLFDRELYWMDYYNSCNSNHGYNLRRDSSTKCIVHDNTRKLMSLTRQGVNNSNYNNKWTDDMKSTMSNIAIDRHKSGKYYNQEWKNKLAESSKLMWKDENIRNSIIEKVRIAKQLFDFFQYDKNTKEFIKKYDSIYQIECENPLFKRHPIYSVCSGTKPSYRGYIYG